jgi:hypothetical protein
LGMFKAVRVFAAVVVVRHGQGAAMALLMVSTSCRVLKGLVT